MLKMLAKNKLSAFLTIVVFVLATLLYQTYWMLSCTTYAYLSDEVSIRCTIEGHEKTVRLTEHEAKSFRVSWSQSAFSPDYQAMCHEPAFDITFHNIFIDTRLKDVCFQCHNFPALFGLMGFKPSRGSEVYSIMLSHFPGVGFERYFEAAPKAQPVPDLGNALGVQDQKQ